MFPPTGEIAPPPSPVNVSTSEDPGDEIAHVAEPAATFVKIHAWEVVSSIHTVPSS